MISYGKQYIDKKDIQSVTKVLRSDWITQGPKIKEFENLLKKYFKWQTEAANFIYKLYT